MELDEDDVLSINSIFLDDMGAEEVVMEAEAEEAAGVDFFESSVPKSKFLGVGGATPAITVEELARAWADDGVTISTTSVSTYRW